MTDQETTQQITLESVVAMPRGGVAPRCQRRKKNGRQCGKAARTGRKVCPSHGAGYPSREESGECKKPGRPVTHAMYSTQPTRTFAECQAELASLEDILDNSDRDLLALKASLIVLLNRLEAHAPAVERMEAVLETLTVEAERMDADEITPHEALSFVRRLAELQKPAARLNTLIVQVTDATVKSVNANKTRAETKSKLAESEGLMVFLRLLAVQRKIFHGLAPDENTVAAYEMELQRQIFGPLHLEAPALDNEVSDVTP